MSTLFPNPLLPIVLMIDKLYPPPIEAVFIEGIPFFIFLYGNQVPNFFIFFILHLFRGRIYNKKKVLQ